MAGMANHCCMCGQPADFELTSRKVGPAVKVREVLKQPYVTYYLCATHTKNEIVREDPPRGARALPHHAALLKRQLEDQRRELVGHVEVVRLGDWGKR